MNRTLKQQIIDSIAKRGPKTWYSTYLDVDEMDSAHVRTSMNQLVAEGIIIETHETGIDAIVYSLPSYYFISYAQRDVGVSTWDHYNTLIDIHPLEWLVVMRTELPELGSFALIGWQEISKEIYDAYSDEVE